MYTVIQASEEQIQKLYKKHLRFPVFNCKFAYDSEDNVGFFSCNTITSKSVSCQVRHGEVCFVEFTGFGNVRYDISYPEGEMNTRLKKIALEAQDAFWAGAEI